MVNGANQGRGLWDKKKPLEVRNKPDDPECHVFPAEVSLTKTLYLCLPKELFYSGFPYGDQ